jgi:hypothetical protein
MSQKRAGLSLEDDQIDLEELTGGAPQAAPVDKDKLRKSLDKVGEKTGFVSREPRRRRRSPYTAQFGGKCREGMKALFQEIGEELGCYDTETLERAILALIEKEKLTAIQKEYEKLINR